MLELKTPLFNTPERVMAFFSRRRALIPARRRLREVAGGIGARDGLVLLEQKGGSAGLDGNPRLAVVTLRPGTADEVLAAQIDSAVAFGYRRPRTPPNGFGIDTGRPRSIGCKFPTREGLPELNLEVYPAGRHIRGTELEVPDGHAGVIVGLHLHV
jgi:hypothetical protein